jgi:hypothetical protein
MCLDRTFTELFKAERYVTAFAVGSDHIFLLAGNHLYQLDKRDGQAVHERLVFAKEGLSRSLTVDDAFLYVKDFCDLHILEKETLAPVQELRLGTDSSSDICGMGVDERYLYLSIRNGSMARLEKGRSFQPEIYPVTDSSIWDFVLWNDLIYAGSVDGRLLIIDKASMAVVQTIQASKQNLKSVLVTENILVTASQDKKMVVRDAKTYDILASLASVHQRAFSIVGMHENQVYTISYPCGEVKVWDAESGALRETIHFPGGHGHACFADQRLYLASRNTHGLVYMDL